MRYEELKSFDWEESCPKNAVVEVKEAMMAVCFKIIFAANFRAPKCLVCAYANNLEIHFTSI